MNGGTLGDFDRIQEYGYMVEHTEPPGPGEEQDHAASGGETYSVPIPANVLPHLSGPQHLTQEMQPVTADELDEARDSVQHDDDRRRTGTERDGYEAVTASDIVTERRLDGTADDYLREEATDPAQDNAGPME
jgi:hypothetical protein